MPKLLLHANEARQKLAAGVRRLAAAVEPTLGPKGMNAMVDRPIGTPLITRDGVSIASEIELFDRFENMGAQVVREVSMQTNEVAGDGTTTSIVLANGIIQGGVDATSRGAKAVDLCRGIDRAVEIVLGALKEAARPAEGDLLDSVARIAATSDKLGAMVAEAYRAVGPEGVISTEFAVGIESELEVVEGMSFDRGYISHHLVTDQEAMRAELASPYILLTDLKLTSPDQLAAVRAIAAEDDRPLLIVSEDCSAEVLASILGRDAAGRILVVRLCCTERLKAELPLSPRRSADGSCDGDAERGIAVEDGDADLEFGGLAVEVAGHELLPEELHAVHLGLGAASAVVSAPSAPDRAAEALDGAQSLVPRFYAGAVLLPRLGISPGRDDSVRAAVRDGVAAAAGVVGAVGGDRDDWLVCWDLAEQVR